MRADNTTYCADNTHYHYHYVLVFGLVGDNVGVIGMIFGPGIVGVADKTTCYLYITVFGLDPAPRAWSVQTRLSASLTVQGRCCG